MPTSSATTARRTACCRSSCRARPCKTIAERGHAKVDLESQTVDEFSFEIDPEIKRRLLNGLDDISLTLQQAEKIDAYEATRERSGPVTTALG